jgi:hypothetical protein
MAKARFKPEELLAQGRPTVATLPDSAPATPFLDPSIAQAEPQGSELYNLGTVQQTAASTRDTDMFNPSYLQEPQNYPTGAEGGIPQPQGASPLLYPTAAEAQPKLKARLKPNEALALAEVNRPRRKSPDEMMDELAVGMFDPSKTPLPQDLWGEATQRRSKMIQEGRLPMESYGPRTPPTELLRISPERWVVRPPRWPLTQRPRRDSSRQRLGQRSSARQRSLACRRIKTFSI